jgi:cytochrome c oxidase cbb3-type subunit 3
LGLFYGTIAFSFVYVAYFHGGPGLLPAEAYEAEMKAFYEWEAEQALAAGEVTEETLQKLMADEGTVLTGRSIFEASCVECHGASGEGKIGPNLTDAHWLHGATLVDIHHTVAEGVPDKGMRAWKRVLRPEEVLKVSAYVGTLRGTDVAGKAPEGVKVDIEAIKAGGAPQAKASPAEKAAPAN